MKKCRSSEIYEQVGDNKLVTCKLDKGECIYQGRTFNSSSDSIKKYIVCNEKGLAEKTTIEEHLEKEKRKEYLETEKMIDDLVNPAFK